MVLESTMICLDNSDWMRNGDYLPTRVEAQKDAAGIVCNDRLVSNPENTVGILTMAGQGVDMLVSPTEEVGKVLACFSRIKLGGKSDIVTALQIAQLALKHRKNKNGGQRIVVFIGCPVVESVEALQKLGKQLKKNNVAIDVISMGEIDDNNAKLQELINATNTNDNCHLLTVPAGISPATALVSSPIMHSAHTGAGSGGAGAAGGDFDMYGGVDPELDPELAMALRVSAEEARQEEEARLRAQNAAGGNGAAPAGSSATVPSSSGGAVVDDEEDEETLMQRAIAMSMMEAEAAANNEAASGAAAQTMDVDGDDEDEELQKALAMSRGEAPSTSASGGSGFDDPDFVNQLLGNADQNDPLIRAALEQLRSAGEGDKKEGEEDKTKKRKKDDE